MYTANKARCSTVWLRVLGWCWLLQSSWRTGCSVMLLWTSRGTTTCFRGWTNMRTKLCWNTQLGPSSLWLRVSYLLIMRAQYTGLFEMTVGVLTTCHTQYTWDSSISVFFLFNRTTLQVSVTYLTGALYVHPLWFYRVIRNDCRGFNNLSYTIHLR